MILIINICKEKLHYYEFVKPIEDIVKQDYFTKHYKEISQADLERASKIIICGTSLKDEEYLKNLENFNWIKDFQKPILGICGGAQIIGLIFGGKLKTKTEIGLKKVNFQKEFLGTIGEKEVYELHNHYVEFNDDFEIFAKNELPQATKHKSKEVFCTLFHPEVRQKQIINNFANR